MLFIIISRAGHTDEKRKGHWTVGEKVTRNQNLLLCYSCMYNSEQLDQAYPEFVCRKFRRVSQNLIILILFILIIPLVLVMANE